jgi:hypothetical protein
LEDNLGFIADILVPFPLVGVGVGVVVVVVVVGRGWERWRDNLGLIGDLLPLRRIEHMKCGICKTK